MHRPELRELAVFAEVARQLNFTRAAAALNMSLPSLSQTLKGLEEKVGVRLLTRTTRSVSVTDAGVQLLADIELVFASVDSALDGLNSYRDSAGGSLRILCSNAASTIFVGPLMGPFLAAYPAIDVEIVVDDGRVDLVAERIDAGIQVGGRIEKDMITQKLIDPFEERLFASTAYLRAHDAITRPEDLSNHHCVRLRSQYEGVIAPWQLSRGEKTIDVQAGKQFVANNLRVIAAAIISGAGVGLLPPVMAASETERGVIEPVLPDWGSPVPGIYLFYLSRRQTSKALNTFITFMRDNRPATGWVGNLCSV